MIYRKTVAYFYLFVGCGMSSGILGGSLEYLREFTSSNRAEISVLFSAKAIGSILGALIMGRLYDRIPGHWGIVGVTAMTALAASLVPVSPNLMWLVVILFFVGFGEISINSGGNTMLLWTHGDKSPPWVTALHFCYGLGAMLGPLLIWGSVELTGQFYSGFWAIALWMLPVGVAFLFLPSPEIPKTIPKSTKDVPWKTFLMIGSFLGVYIGAEIAFSGWIVTYGREKGMALETATILATCYWGALTFGRLLNVYFVRRYSAPSILFGSLIGSMMVLGLLLVANHPWVLFGAVSLFGLCMSPIFPTMFAYGNQRVAFSGNLIGILFVIGGASAMIFPTAVGPLVEYLGRSSMVFFLIAILASAGGVLMILLRQEARAIQPVG